ncbi:Hydroxyacid oxidase 1 [Fusarium oxysporum f. sp. albedinis]|nr:Hydroxyacid oxidase 1 [Fusarium oxysporum f. sp. albedinis]
MQFQGWRTATLWRYRYKYIKILPDGQLTVDEGRPASSLAEPSAPDGPGPESALVPGLGHRARGSLPVPVSGPGPGPAGGAV